jgi:hypothetical protein
MAAGFDEERIGKTMSFDELPVGILKYLQREFGDASSSVLPEFQVPDYSIVQSLHLYVSDKGNASHKRIRRAGMPPAKHGAKPSSQNTTPAPKKPSKPSLVKSCPWRKTKPCQPRPKLVPREASGFTGMYSGAAHDVQRDS